MRTRTLMSAIALGTTVLALVGAAACARSSASPGVATAGGKGSASAHPTASVDPQEQAREFAQCMRDHGVDMPDPDTDGGGGVRVTISGGPNSNMDAAMNACKDKLPDGGTPPSMNPQQQEQMREFAQCMRDHGVDMPDPDPNSGALRITQSGAAPAFGPDDPTFKAAQEACQDKLPGANGGIVTNGSGSDNGGPGFGVSGGGL